MTRFGGKAAQLQVALRHGLPVPPGVALDWDAVQGFAPDDSPLVERVAARVDLPRGAAVRSSGVGEWCSGSSRPTSRGSCSRAAP